MDSVKLYATSTAIELGKKIGESLGVPLYKIHSEKFSDGELFVRFEESVRGQTVFLIAKIDMPYEHFFEMLMTVDAARRSSAREVVLIVPYLPHSRQERRDGQRTSISSRMVADIIQLMGADRIITLDLHTNAIEGFYKIPMDPLSSLRLFVDHIMAWLRSYLLCSRIRRNQTHKAIQKNVNADMAHHQDAIPNQFVYGIMGMSEQNIVIIDDLVDTGGPLCAAANI